MIRNVAMWRAWEDRYNASQPADYPANLRRLDAMLAEAQALGRWRDQDPLADLPRKIAFARAVNVRISAQKTGPGA